MDARDAARYARLPPCAEERTMPIDLSGGCQCGAIRYRATVQAPHAYYCHCRMRQRAFGNVFATLFNMPVADVAWERGELRRYRSSKLAQRGFCGVCGT